MFYSYSVVSDLWLSEWQLLVGLSFLVAEDPFPVFHTLLLFPPFLFSLLISSHPISLLPFSVLCLDEWFSKGKSLVFSRTCEAVHPSHHIILLMHIETPGEITLNLHAFHRHDHT